MEAFYPMGIARFDWGIWAVIFFFTFLASLIVYCRREDKREGYPLISDPNDKYGAPRLVSGSIPRVPKPKTFLLRDGRTIQVPRQEKVEWDRNYKLEAQPTAPWPGSPLEPMGNPMKAAVGPGAYAKREDKPEMTWHKKQKIVPMRIATDYYVVEDDPDLRGAPVVGLCGGQGGKVRDIWVDRSECRIMYYEVDLSPHTSGKDSVLLPQCFARETRRTDGVWEIRVNSITAEQFRDVPRLANADQITPQEEDMVCAYYGAGTLYAVPSRREPFLP